VVSSTIRPHFTPRKDPVPILQETGWATGPVWTGAENLVPTGIRSQTAQPVAQSLYRLSYQAHLKHVILVSKTIVNGLYTALINHQCEHYEHHDSAFK